MEKDKKELGNAQSWIQTDWFGTYEDLMYHRFNKEKYDKEKQDKEELYKKK